MNRAWEIISIHAPAWGATRAPGISIHAPAWGATRCSFCNQHPCVKFQSTHPHGVRLFQHQQQALDQTISIHAPAWGATALSVFACFSSAYFNPRTRMGCDCYVSSHSLCLGNFNPRTRMGCDISYRLFIINTFLFQSTHPHGVRHQICNCDRQFLGFQSTHPHGVRLAERQTSISYIRISIHAPAWGATLCKCPHLYKRLISIHAPAWGATKNARLFRRPTSDFNPRTRMGCDRQVPSPATNIRIFQSTHPHGVRLLSTVS